MEDRSLAQSKTNRTRAVIVAVAYTASLASLYWTLHDADLGRMWSDLTSLDAGWILFAMISMNASYWIQGLRWTWLVAPVTKLRVLPATRAVFVGLFTSELLPIRIGEVIRCLLASRWTDLPLSVSLASVLIERVFDGILMWMGIRYVLSTVQVHVPRSQTWAVNALGVVVLSGVLLLAVALFRPKLQPSDRPTTGLRRRWFVLQEDLALIGHSGYLWAAFGATVPYLLLQVITVYVLFEQYQFHLSFGVALVLMMLIRLAAAVPQAPMTLGLFQLLTREYLHAGFHIPSAEAARFSLVLWAVVKLPILIGGAVAVAITGTKLSELVKAAGDAHNEPYGS